MQTRLTGATVSGIFIDQSGSIRLEICIYQEDIQCACDQLSPTCTRTYMHAHDTKRTLTSTVPLRTPTHT